MKILAIAFAFISLLKKNDNKSFLILVVELLAKFNLITHQVKY